ncbi:hypothetical protein ACFWUP_23715 [Nocardia sp. NPDC058658]|uniref:hypothetical protein n=1 Tax=Nocardia sp. NPDC058658 TaxID=3346580 RepID=UPI003661C5B9
MSGADPVEESGQAMRQGFVQALQTAHMTHALMNGRGGESRSQAESDQRMQLAQDKDHRSWVEHRLRVAKTHAEVEQSSDLNAVRIEEIRARMSNASKVTDVELDNKQLQRERADKDFDRREQAGRLDRRDNAEAHDYRVTGYRQREARSVELHKLDVEYKKLLIEIRRRAAGFSESLHLDDDSDAARTMSSAARFAAADATSGLSTEHAATADAYRERFAADTGTTAHSMVGEVPGPVVSDGMPTSPDSLGGIVEALTTESHHRAPFDPPMHAGHFDQLGPAGHVLDDAVAATGTSEFDPLNPDGVDPTPNSPSGPGVSSDLGVDP